MNREQRFRAGVGLVALTALGLRALHLRAVYGAPLHGTLVQDARHYHDVALDILGGAASASASVSFMNPGYPYLVAAVYALAGPSPVFVASLQALLGACTTAALAWTVRRWFQSDPVALVSGSLYAAYTGAIFYDGLLLTPSIVNVLVVAGLAFVAAGRPALSGLCLAAAVPVRPNMAPLIAALAPVWRRRRALFLFVGVALATLLPFGLYNGLVRGQWVAVSANGGANFWIGNNTRAQGVYHAADFVADLQASGEREGFLFEARRRTGDAGLDLAAADRFWFAEGLREIRAAPWRWLRVETRKLALFWNHYESKTNVGLAFVRELSPVLRFNPVGFGPLAVCSFAGFVLLVLERRRQVLWIVSSLVAIPALTCLLFFVSGEYRHAASPALCIAAALALCRLAGFVRSWLRAGKRPPLGGLGPALFVGVLAVPLVYWSFPPLVRTFHPRLDYSNHARAMIADEPTPRGFRRALDLLDHASTATGVDPFLLEARLEVTGRAAVELGDAGMARRFVDTAESVLALRLRPDPAVLPPRFLEQLYRTIDLRARELTRRELARDDPELADRLRALVAVE